MSRTIQVRDGVGVTAHIIQRNSLGFVREFESPALIFVLNGTKTLRRENQTYIIRAGECVAIDAGLTFEIVNEISTSGDYEAWWMTWEPSLLSERHQRLSRAENNTVSVWPIRKIEPAFQQSIEKALTALSDGASVPTNIARHQLHEILIWLEHYGVQFQPIEISSVSGKIRQLIAGDPAYKWSAPHLAKLMAMSEATLRRRLVSEQGSLTELIIDVRMNFALTLLQSTDYPVSQIALYVGYESQSKFAIRFRKRFGFSPMMVREKSKMI
jgi:AraC-like DNA-binding protein